MINDNTNSMATGPSQNLSSKINSYNSEDQLNFKTVLIHILDKGCVIRWKRNSQPVVQTYHIQNNECVVCKWTGFLDNRLSNSHQISLISKTVDVRSGLRTW